jgi:ADP-ribose pyrophosphatase YjhB (NUDIX family)
MRHAARAIVVKDDTLLVIRRNKFGNEYYTLPGGGIDKGETPEQAVLRELAEETGVNVTLERLVFTEHPGPQFGSQQIFLCAYKSGEPALHPGSEEAISNGHGQNLYTPMWLPLSDLGRVVFMSPVLQQALKKSFANGFPASPEPL